MSDFFDVVGGKAREDEDLQQLPWWRLHMREGMLRGTDESRGSCGLPVIRH